MASMAWKTDMEKLPHREELLIPQSKLSRIKTGTRSIVRILETSVPSSTAHAVTRVASAERDPLVRILWLLAFFVFLGLTLNSSFAYLSRLQNPSVKSEFAAEKVDFEFPDVYFCNSLQAAGSFTFLLTDEEAARVNTPFAAAARRFSSTLMSMNASSNVDLLKLKLLSALQSLPYRVLADIVGQRRLQTFYRNYGIFTAGSSASTKSPVKIETLYHPNHLNCFKLALGEAEFTKMRNPNNRMQFDLLLDPYFFTFHKFSLYSNWTAWLPIVSVTDSGHTYSVYSFDWNLDDPMEIDRGSGMYLYLVPRGHYPSRLTTNLLSLAPGRAYDIVVSMSDSQKTPGDFPGQCVDKHDPVKFFNPYDGSADAFEYSDAHCYYTEIAKAAQQSFNCSPVFEPLPWEFRDLSLCLNLTAASSTEAMAARLQAALAARSLGAANSSSSWDLSCSSKRLCLQRKYQVTSSYGMWPNVGSLYRLVSNIMASLVLEVDRREFRSLVTGVNTLKASVTTDKIAYENGVFDYFARAALRVSLRAETTRSPLVTFSLDYQLSQFISDVGGILGLYLGCSLLTLLELAELAYDCWPFGFSYF